MDVLITTIYKRPYVVAFLITYILMGSRLMGKRWTMLTLVSGYAIAWLSEYLSINYGFPYGEYHYIYENMTGEWMNNGVPVWDSVSYVFLCFAGMTLASFALRGKIHEGFLGYVIWILLGAFFTTLLDVIIDPLTHMGDRWFLGQIYYYPNPGVYFDVPFSNFVGWLVTCSFINAASVIIGTSKFIRPGSGFAPWKNPSGLMLLPGIGLYFGVAVFNMGITAFLGEWLLLAVDMTWMILLILIIWKLQRTRN